MIDSPPGDEQIDAIVADLRRRLAALPDEQDIATPREREAAFHERRRLAAQIAAITTSRQTLAEVAPQLERYTAWLRRLEGWRGELCADLLTIKSPMRQKAVVARSHDLTLSLRVCDRGLAEAAGTGYDDIASLALGKLMARDGYTAATFVAGIKASEKAIARLRARRAGAEATLAAALVPDDERRRREAEADLLAATYNRLRVKIGPPGGPVVVVRADGTEVSPDALTADERRAIELLGNAPKRRREAAASASGTPTGPERHVGARPCESRAELPLVRTVNKY